jgi:hypothetical protein
LYRPIQHDLLSQSRSKPFRTPIHKLKG